jgi:excisionase family DNA binding protein
MDVDVRTWLAETLGRIERKCDGLERQLSGRTKPLLTVEEAAAEVGRTPYTIRRWISERRLRADRIQGTGPQLSFPVVPQPIRELPWRPAFGALHLRVGMFLNCGRFCTTVI